MGCGCGKLTILCQGVAMRAVTLALLALGLAACGNEAAREAADQAALVAEDPVIARALNDPLMSDPDLASRNEANAALGFPDSHALPVIAARGADASAAREAQRMALLADGPIPNLPRPRERKEGEAALKALGPMASAGDLLEAVGAPATCAARLREDFALAASLPPPAALPPEARVMQAGGADGKGCGLRIIRYTTAAAPEDVLQYHYTKARRAGLRAARYAEPEAILRARGKNGAALTIQARPALHGLTGVDLIYRAP